MSDNLSIYNRVKAVPENAKKTISGGKLNGFTDISPMWRIKVLTEEFGSCGVGWYTEITRQWELTLSNGEVMCFCNVNLFVKIDGEWSKPIFGTGGSKLAAAQKGGVASSDEGFKMAYTDAISVACKALGVGADVYWEKDATKYDMVPEKPAGPFCVKCGKRITAQKARDGRVVSAEEAAKSCGGLCVGCWREAKKNGQG